MFVLTVSETKKVMKETKLKLTQGNEQSYKGWQIMKKQKLNWKMLNQTN